MKLLIIHGPPGVGKLTVANAVAERTGFKVFHNHLSIDCVKPIFEFFSPPFMRVLEKIRTETIAEAARSGVDLIHTFVYVKDEDDAYFRRLIAAAEDNGGEVCVVQLYCSDEERKRRIVDESRIRIGKLTDAEAVDRARERGDLESMLPGQETLVIDNTVLSPEETADQIKEEFDLPDVV